MTYGRELAGRRILVVEDDFYQAHDAAQALREAGASVLGPCATQESSVQIMAQGRPDAAVLDINLGAGLSFELAHRLRSEGVPFIFVTGYDAEVILQPFRDVERLEKPVPALRLVEALARITPHPAQA